MNRAIVTFASGEYDQLLAVSLPPMQRYADRHGWMVIAATGTGDDFERPPSWMKIPILQAALRDFDEVLWIDADVVIADDSRDITDEVPADAWQALVEHHTADGAVPNCGVWLVRRPMAEYLDRLWSMTEYLHHGWWEQAALLQLLGYREQPRPVCHVRDTALFEATAWLGREWNSHEQSDRHPDPRFAHATAGNLPWRLAVMRRYAALIPANGGPAR